MRRRRKTSLGSRIKAALAERPCQTARELADAIGARRHSVATMLGYNLAREVRFTDDGRAYLFDAPPYQLVSGPYDHAADLLAECWECYA